VTTEEITRSGMQALWRNMPRQPFQWGPHKVSVLGRTPRNPTPLDVPEEYVAAQLRRLVRPFSAQRATATSPGPELEVIDRQQYQLVKVEDLVADRFPNAFLCRKCNAFATVRPQQRPPDCPAGHGPMPQFQFAEVHNCGLLRDLAPPRCPRGCRAPMQLHNTHQLKVGQWFWACSQCRTRPDGGVLRFCSECRAGRVSVTRVPQNSVHYAQHLTVLNPPDRASYGALAGADIRAAAVGQLLGAVGPGLTALAQAAGTASEDPEAAARTIAATLGIDEGTPLFGQLLDAARAKAASSGGWRADVDALGLDADTLEAVGDEALALARASEAEALTLEHLIANPPSASLTPVYHRYAQLLDRYSLTEVRLLRELPVAHIVAGYSRMSATHQQVTRRGNVPTRFNFFPNERSDRFPMYGRRATTEGLLVRVDPVAVISWLVDSLPGDVPDPGITESAAAYRWLLQACPPVTDVFNPPDHPVTGAVLGLVHSMAHRFMKSLATRCGLHIDSLAEYLFPSAAAFLVYANTRSEFTLGGIEHMFRYDLADALEELDADPRCVFDPPCRRSFGGACAACLHTSEVACERFNTELDRNKLFGTLPPPAGAGAPSCGSSSAEPVWRAFWKG
jgi:hypothetical protein